MEHHHHEHEACSCGNDHHEHEACTCGHEHHHHEQHCPYHIHGHIHEGAAAVSGRLTLPGSLYNQQEAVSKMLEGIAAQIRDAGGIVGHIKASATERKSAIFSVTKDKATVTPCEGDVLELSVTLIAFSVNLGTLEHWLHEALGKLEKKEYV